MGSSGSALACSHPSVEASHGCYCPLYSKLSRSNRLLTLRTTTLTLYRPSNMRCTKHEVCNNASTARDGCHHLIPHYPPTKSIAHSDAGVLETEPARTLPPELHLHEKPHPNCAPLVWPCFARRSTYSTSLWESTLLFRPLHWSAPPPTIPLLFRIHPALPSVPISYPKQQSRPCYFPDDMHEFLSIGTKKQSLNYSSGLAPATFFRLCQPTVCLSHPFSPASKLFHSMPSPSLIRPLPLGSSTHFLNHEAVLLAFVQQQPVTPYCRATSSAPGACIHPSLAEGGRHCCLGKRSLGTLSSCMHPSFFHHTCSSVSSYLLSV